MHEVTPRVVPMAVRMARSVWMTKRQVAPFSVELLIVQIGF